MTEYPLQPFETVAGTISVTLFSDQVGLTVPTVNTIVEVGDLEETADVNIGITQLSTLSITIQDNYVTYTEGFWYKVLASECWVRFYLDEGAGDTFYFFGIPQSETIVWIEHFNDESSYVRTAEMELLSMASVLLGTTTEDWVTEIQGNDVNTGFMVTGEPAYYISVLGMFSAMLSASGLNATYSESDTSFIYSTEDFKFEHSAAFYRVDEIKLCTRWWDVILAAFTDYFAVGGARPNRLVVHFSLLRDLIPQLLTNFGLVMRMDYDTGTERHKIQLIQRGRAYADAARLTFGNQPKTGTIQKSFDLLGDATRATHLIDTGEFTWFSRKYLEDRPSLPAYDKATPPDYVEFDRDMQCIFKIDSATAYGGSFDLGKYIFVLDGSSKLQLVTQIQYYNYKDDQYENGAVATTTKRMEEAIAGYIYYRFTNEYTSIIRTYSGIKANNATTDSHVNASILQRTSINDGATTANFYANKVTKSIANDELTIEWILE